MKELLKKTLHEFGISISDGQLMQFEKFYDYLLEVNQEMNLTAITEEKDIIIKHFLDSLSVMKYVSFENITSVMDVGTGAGFPGIPLAIMFPGCSFTLMDSLNKRIRFLHDVSKRCDIKNIECIHGRAEELGKDKKYREKYDLCVSRAVANLSVLLEYCVPFVKKGGIFVSYKSQSVEEELAVSKNAQKKLSCKLKEKYLFSLGEQEYSRTLLCFEKYDILSKTYPRQNGIPKKKPL